MSFTAIACLLAEAIASMSEEGENPMAVGGEARHGTVAVSWKLSRLKTRTCRAASKAASHCHCKCRDSKYDGHSEYSEYSRRQRATAIVG